MTIIVVAFRFNAGSVMIGEVLGYSKCAVEGENKRMGGWNLSIYLSVIFDFS